MSMKLVEVSGMKALCLGPKELTRVRPGEKAKVWCALVKGLHPEYKFDRVFCKKETFDGLTYVILEPEKIYDCFSESGIEGVKDSSGQEVKNLKRCYLHFEADELKRLDEFDVYVIYRTNKTIKQMQDEKRKKEREANAPAGTSRFRKEI